jgi:hypothetical protein
MIKFWKFCKSFVQTLIYPTKKSMLVTLKSLNRLLYLVRIRSEGEDKLWWVPSKRGLFGVKSFTVSWVVMMVSVSLGRVFGELRFC